MPTPTHDLFPLEVIKAVAAVIGGCATVIAVVYGVRTYYNAKKGWLSPVHVEYQKLVLVRLTRMFEELALEVDESSEQHFLATQERDIALVLQKTYELYQEDPDAFQQVSLPYSTPSSAFYQNKWLAARIDILLPEELRTDIATFWEKRLDANRNIFANLAQQYADVLVNEGPIVPERFRHRLDVLDTVDRYGGAIETTLHRASELSKQAREYLDRFNPLHSPKQSGGQIDTHPAKSAKNRATRPGD